MASILIVEDEPELRDVFRVILQKAGYEVFAAGTVREAMAAFDAHQPDVVLSDVILPDASGLALIQHVSRNPDTSVVVVSGSDSDGMHDLLEAALLLGACTTLRKPVRRADLAAAVEDALARTRRQLRSHAS